MIYSVKSLSKVSKNSTLIIYSVLVNLLLNFINKCKWQSQLNACSSETKLTLKKYLIFF